MPISVPRRSLTRRELLPAIGVGLGAGVVVAYLAQILLRRERPGVAAEPPAPESAPRGPA